MGLGLNLPHRGVKIIDVEEVGSKSTSDTESPRSSNFLTRLVTSLPSSLGLYRPRRQQHSTDTQFGQPNLASYSRGGGARSQFNAPARQPTLTCSLTL